VHLRWPYQLMVGSGAYLLSGLYQAELDARAFAVQYANVHLLLLGGATVYNSFWDRDQGPVGGLRHPPALAPWTRPAAWGVQLVGLLVAALAGLAVVALYALAMALFWLYSSPGTRWKGNPYKSLAVIGVGNGLALFLLGYFAAGPRAPGLDVLAAGAGVALVLLSLYPASQVFQLADDARRGDRTFARRYGLAGVRSFFLACYPPGTLLVAGTLALRDGGVGSGVLLTAAVAGAFIWRVLGRLRGVAADYGPVMRLKYVTSGLFVAFIAACLAAAHVFELLVL
jgi:hypothetical protein